MCDAGDATNDLAHARQSILRLSMPKLHPEPKLFILNRSTIDWKLTQNFDRKCNLKLFPPTHAPVKLALKAMITEGHPCK